MLLYVLLLKEALNNHICHSERSEESSDNQHDRFLASCEITVIQKLLKQKKLINNHLE